MVEGSGGVDLLQIAAEIEAVRPDLTSLNEVDSRTLRTSVDERPISPKSPDCTWLTDTT